MNEIRKNITYVIVLIILSIILYREYVYIIPYNLDSFAKLFWPVESTYSITWIFLFLCSVFLILPLFFERSIGILGVLFFISVVAKPFIIKKVPTETAFHFFNERKVAMEKIIVKHQRNENLALINKEVEELGFEQLTVEGNTYIFIVHGIIDNSYGFCFDADDKTPQSILGASSFFDKIEVNWYEFVTT